MKRSEKMAAKLYLRGALAGDPVSANEVGRMYRWGIGVTKDPGIAKIWYDWAESRGYKEKDGG